MADITMPQLGETVTEGTIIKWLKQVGDHVAQDEPLFEVSTDKVDSEVPSSVDGFLSEILVDEGATVDVGTRLAVVSDAAPSNGSADGSAGAAAVAEAVAEAGPAAAADEEVPEAPSPLEAQAPAAAAEAAGAAVTMEAPSAATELGPIDLPADAHSEPAATGRPTPDVDAAPENAEPIGEVRVPPSAPPDGSAQAGSGSVLLSPVVRKLIIENDLDPAEIGGTGLGGRITRGDVLSYLDARSARSGGAAPPAGAAPAARPAAAPAERPAAGAVQAALAFPPAQPGERDEVVPFTNIRRLTAEHMVRSKATSAHTLVGIEADYEAVDRVRRRFKERFREEEGISLTYLPFIARAVVDVLRDYPNLNASVGEDALLVHRDVHLGIAVDLDRQGLIVPVVRKADGQSLRGLARAIADLAERARSRRLSADDVVGGTFTITNPGPFGTFITAPIINQPQVAILSTDGVKRRPVVVTGADGSEAIAIHSVGMLALSFDHRAVDGAYASAFLRDLARELETRDWESEL